MPPEVYAKASSESRIKAIATIVDVQIIQVGARSTTKNVKFKLEYALTTDTADTFTGSCYSIDNKKQKANLMVGGETYFYPSVGDRVFVTVKKDGAHITSMTPMSDELEQIVREEPVRIKYGITQVSIGDKDSHKQQIKQFEPVLRGKKPAPKDQGTFTLLGETWIAKPEQSAEDLNVQLLVALGNNDLPEVKQLLDSGADVNVTDDYGNTLLMNATVQDNAEMVKLLLELGADKLIRKNGDGSSAKDIAYEMRHRHMFQLLE